MTQWTGESAGAASGFSRPTAGVGGPPVASHFSVEMKRQSAGRLCVSGGFGRQRGLGRFSDEVQSSYSVLDAATNLHRWMLG